MRAQLRTLFLSVGLLLSFFSGGTSAATTNNLDELAKLPSGLKVVLSPDKVRAEREGRSRRAFTWTYKTSVTATNGPVVLQEFGSFTWRQDKWVPSTFSGKPFTSQDFADWYGCPEAKLVEGQEYSDSSNWSGGDVLRGGKMKWYFIGVAADGHRVKGEAVVELLPEVK
jgi:hypothetical protein